MLKRNYKIEVFEQGSTAQALRMTVAQAVRQALINAGGVNATYYEDWLLYQMNMLKCTRRS